MPSKDVAATEEPYVLYDVADGVATITLNRPDQLNPISHGPNSMQGEITERLIQADRDDGVGCVIITGAGRAFSAGGPIGRSTPPESGLDWYRFLQTEDDDNEKIRQLSKPVIGAINGICYGAGFMMAVHFDFIIASDEARFGLIETRFGGTGAEALHYLLGPQWAKFMALTGELITAQKAKEIGIVLEVVAPNALMARARDLARRIAAMPRDTMLLNRRLINEQMNASGWVAQKQTGLALNAVVNSRFKEHRAWNGEKFFDLLRKGWREYKEVRDAPFKEPWLSGGATSAAQAAGARTAIKREISMSKTFPAVVVDTVDGKAVASLKDIKLSDLPDLDVLVEVEFSSLNYKDGLVVCGNRNKVARKLPMVGGIDLAGVVVESRSPDWRPGDKVLVNGWGLSETQWGGFSRYQRVDAKWLLSLPDAFSTKQAMGIGTAGYTAALCVEALDQWGSLRGDGGEVLVTGAAGGVGSVAIALLAASGKSATASTGRSETHDYLRRLGAANIIDRAELTEKGSPLQKERWTAAIDSVGGATLANVLAQTAYGGAVAACGLAGGMDLPATVLPHILRSVTLIGIDSVMAPTERRKRAWARLARDLDLNILDEVMTVEPMSRVIEIGPDIVAGKVRGRVVIDVTR